MDGETVKLHITIKIDQDDPEVDTGITVETWNTLTDHERSQVVRNLWEEMAGRDDGGISVVTEGAEGV